MTKIKKNPYPHQNFARAEDFLEELILWGSGEKGRTPIDELDQGYQDLTISSSQAKSLSAPETAVSAEIHIEADPSVSKPARVIRYKQNGRAPTTTSGMALGDGDILEVFGKENLDLFRVIGIQTGKSHILRIQYFKSAQK